MKKTLFGVLMIIPLRRFPCWAWLISVIRLALQCNFGEVSLGPFVGGAEYITAALLQTQWEKLLGYFRTEIDNSEGSVEAFLKQFALNSYLHGRIFFHLVEHKEKQSCPFAFLVTYASVIDEKGRTKHLPLKAALNEYGESEHKLVELLNTVRKAAQSSAFISGSLESGEIFYPLLMTV